MTLTFPKPTKPAKRKRKTPDDFAYIEAAISLGCAIEGCKHPPQFHHCRGLEFGTGTGLKAPHTCGFGLCDPHHDELHDKLGKKAWEKKYGRQYDIWQTVKAKVEAKLAGL